MKEEEYALLDATGLAGLVARGEVDPYSPSRAAQQRIARLNPTFNAAVTSIVPALEMESWDEHLPPFFGVPTLVKDLHTLVKGSALTHGSRFFKGHISSHDSDLVARMRRTGMSIIGRSNTPEFGINTSTEGAFHGPALNPWNIARSTGGSSGGAAAAVASGMVPIAHATDSGGSIRIPASCCGLVGLKPTRGRIFAGLDEGEGWHDLFHAFFLTRSVRDVAGLLDCLANQDGAVPYLGPTMSGTYKELLRQPCPKYKVGVMRLPPNEVPLDPECELALNRAEAAFSEMGHELIDLHISINGPEMADCFRKVIASSVAATITAHEKVLKRQAREDDFEPVVWQMLRLGRSIDGGELNRAMAQLHLMARDIMQTTSRFDLLLTPTLAKAPLLLGELDASMPDLDVFFQKIFGFAPFTSLFNVTGQPAISLPIHWNQDDLPIGVQCVAGTGREDVLLHIARDFEYYFDWQKRQHELIKRL